MLTSSYVIQLPHYNRESYQYKILKTHGNKPIKCVKILPLKDNGKDVKVHATQGGIGQNYIRLDFKSQIGQGLHYKVIDMG